MIRLKALAAALGVLAVLGTAVPAQAHEEKTGDITIVHPWSRPAAQGQNGVIYLGVRQPGCRRRSPDRRQHAARREGRASPEHDGRGHPPHGKVESIVVPAGGTVELAPGGLHVMLVGLKFMLMAEETIPVTFTFEGAGAITTGVSVEAPGGDDHDH